MASTPEAAFYENQSSIKLVNYPADRIATRLIGDLEAGTVIAKSASAGEIIRVKRATLIRVRVKFTGTGTGKTSMIPMLADGVTEATTGIETSPGTDAAGSEILVDFVCKGETYVTIQQEEDGGAQPITIAYVEIFIY